MNEAQYEQLTETTFNAVEEALDASDAALDYEFNGGVLSIDCEDTDTQVILSRQMPARQVWVAAKSGGFHCDWDAARETWVCTTTGETLSQLLDRVLSEQSDEPVSLGL